MCFFVSYLFVRDGIYRRRGLSRFRDIFFVLILLEFVFFKIVILYFFDFILEKFNMYMKSLVFCLKIIMYKKV